MLRKMQLFASALLASEAAALAVANHRHGHHAYNKRDLVYAHTEVVVETVVVTTTVYDDDAPATSASFFKAVAPPQPTTLVTTTSAAPPPPPPPPPPPAPTTTAAPPPPPPNVEVPKQPEPATSAEIKVADVKVPEVKVPEIKTPATNPPPAPPVASQAPPPPPPPPAVSQTPPPPATGNGGSGSSGSGGSSAPGGNKRGLAYNDAALTTPFTSSGKFGWAYNWGQRPDGLSAPGVEYVPMLWGPIDMHTSTWKKNAEDALNNGAKALLSFNECDFPSQCNKSPAEAAAGHIQWMNPYAGRAAISSPAITNSNIAGQGLDWLRAWVQACNGQCKFDFCAAHWYSPPDPADLLGHLDKVHEICQGKPVWLTEFAPISGDKAKFLADVMKELDTNPKYSYVQRYSYFMVGVGDDKLLSAPAVMNAVGKTYGFA